MDNGKRLVVLDVISNVYFNWTWENGYYHVDKSDMVDSNDQWSATSELTSSYSDMPSASSKEFSVAVLALTNARRITLAFVFISS